MQAPTTYEVIFQSIAAFFFLFILARILGKRQIAQLTFFDYIAGITIGNVAASWSLDEVKTVHAILSLVIWTLLSIIMAFIQKKSYLSRVLLDGRPTVIIQNGEILEKNLSKEHLSSEELMLLLRQKDIFKVSDVEYAVFENNGKLSVMKKSELQPITLKDSNIPVIAEHESRVLIIDGNIMDKSLADLGYSKGWLLGEVMKQGASKLEDVFFAQVDSNGNLYVDLYYDSAKVSKVKMKPLLAASLKKMQADLEKFALETENTPAKKSYEEMASKLKSMIDEAVPFLKG
jgi:uncharacterized membrane protein YcaP (DUF421 family)